MSTKTRTMDLGALRRIIREVTEEVLADVTTTPAAAPAKSEASSEVKPLPEQNVDDTMVDVEDVQVDDMPGPDMSDMGAGDDGSVEEATGFDLDLSTPEAVASALETLADMLARAADAVEDVVSAQGGDSEEMEATEEALSEARKLVRNARRSVLRENARRQTLRTSKTVSRTARKR